MDSETFPFISVIIPVFNDSERLKTCLQLLENQTYSENSYEIIVVDNASNENISKIVQKFGQTTIIYESHQGSYAARNKGISVAKGSVIAFTDVDCLPTPNWIEKGVEALYSVPNCGLVAGKIEFFFKDPDRPTIFELCDSVMHLQQQSYLENARFGATANVFTFKSVFEKVGLFNNELKSGGDYDWGQRVYRAGYQQVYAEDACVAHPARSSFRELYQKITRTTKASTDLGAGKDHPYIFLRDLVRDLKPPIQIFRRIQTNNYLLRLQVFFGVLCIKHLMAFERIKIRAKPG
jgi:glycosyltransferase involved in cell wall biosynthesis